jgi:hypothetical protein
VPSNQLIDREIQPFSKSSHSHRVFKRGKISKTLDETFLNYLLSLIEGQPYAATLSDNWQAIKLVKSTPRIRVFDVLERFQKV